VHTHTHAHAHAYAHAHLCAKSYQHLIFVKKKFTKIYAHTHAFVRKSARVRPARCENLAFTHSRACTHTYTHIPTLAPPLPPHPHPHSYLYAQPYQYRFRKLHNRQAQHENFVNSHSHLHAHLQSPTHLHSLSHTHTSTLTFTLNRINTDSGKLHNTPAQRENYVNSNSYTYTHPYTLTHTSAHTHRPTLIPLRSIVSIPIPKNSITGRHISRTSRIRFLIFDSLSASACACSFTWRVCVCVPEREGVHACVRVRVCARVCVCERVLCGYGSESSTLSASACACSFT